MTFSQRAVHIHTNFDFDIGFSGLRDSGLGVSGFRVWGFRVSWLWLGWLRVVAIYFCFWSDRHLAFILELPLKTSRGPVWSGVEAGSLSRASVLDFNSVDSCRRSLLFQTFWVPCAGKEEIRPGRQVWHARGQCDMTAIRLGGLLPIVRAFATCGIFTKFVGFGPHESTKLPRSMYSEANNGFQEWLFPFFGPCMLWRYAVNYILYMSPAPGFPVPPPNCMVPQAHAPGGGSGPSLPFLPLLLLLLLLLLRLLLGLLLLLLMLLLLLLLLRLLLLLLLRLLLCTTIYYVYFYFHFHFYFYF